mmetsp:Transcript_5078/g.10510  ORF Transcript_5078/g.10510 Transcript_5078/m.10510 type:complete len:226 (-) Transcript_5078:1154-1831(-)
MSMCFRSINSRSFYSSPIECISFGIFVGLALEPLSSEDVEDVHISVLLVSETTSSAADFGALCEFALVSSKIVNTLSMSSILKGLVMKSKAPAARAFSRNSTRAWAVTKTILVASSLSLSRFTMILQASRPSMMGICMSINMQSNLVFSEASTAFFPLSTIVMSVTPTRLRIRSKTFWLMRLSSATRTLMFRGGNCLVSRVFFFGGVDRFFAEAPPLDDLDSPFL